MTWNLLQAGEQRMAAAVPFYGPAPENPDFSKAKAAVYGIYGEQDERVNASRERAEAALKAAGLTRNSDLRRSGHGFFNDTGQRYNQRPPSRRGRTCWTGTTSTWPEGPSADRLQSSLSAGEKSSLSGRGSGRR